MTITTFRAVGMPQTKGSTKSFAFRRGDGTLGTRTTNDNPKNGQWQMHVASEAKRAGVPRAPAPLAVELELVFYLPAAESLTYAERVACTKGNDVDKMSRSVLDALTGIAYDDDKQVTVLVARKKHVTAIDPWGALITVRQEEPYERTVAAQRLRDAARRARGGGREHRHVDATPDIFAAAGVGAELPPE